MNSAATTTLSPAYDCMLGIFNWKKGWTSAKKKWCCKHEDKGCKTTSTIMTTTNISFAAVTKASGVKNSSLLSQGCATKCAFERQSVPCGRRVQWAATHEFAGKTHPCTRSYGLVLQ